MNIQHKQSERGFTIIEVVLVLAIAGLIFAMVFIALPALQRNQRDTQRRNDLSTFKSQMQSFSTNNRGKIVTDSGTLDTFKTGYLKWKSDDSGEFKDPVSGVGYVIRYTDAAPTEANGVTNISYRNGRICNGETMTSSGASTRSFAVAIKLEGSGTYCTDNR